jgi:hypothetical protein
MIISNIGLDMICIDLHKAEGNLIPFTSDILRKRGVIVMTHATANITQLRQSIKLTEG